MHMWGFNGMGWGWGWGLAMAMTMLLFWVLVIVAVASFVRWVADSGRGAMTVPRTPGAESSLEILNARYARGEITREQYLQMRQDVGQRS